MTKVLFVATIYPFFGFEESDMCILRDMGYEVHLASDMKGYKIGRFSYLNVINHQVDFTRSPFNSGSLIAYRQLRLLINEEKFDIIHCHTPVAAALTRFAARSVRKRGTKVIYTDHGFHFHKTSGFRNWLLYYPIEYILAYYTDVIITINKEDLGVIQKFHVPQIVYIPGVGVDVRGIMNMKVDRDSVRNEYGLPNNAFVILSVGELSARKNHEIIIRALAKVPYKDIYYIVCGEGSKKDYLKSLCKEFNISERVMLVGGMPHHKILELNHAVDLAAIPSLIEGLGLVGIEALASGIPIISSNVHGINDYVINGETGLSCNPHDEKAFAEAIVKFYSDKRFYKHCQKNTQRKALVFDIEKVKPIMRNIYQSLSLNNN